MRGFNIDHIRERKTCNSDDFETINYLTNLRLLPAADNLARNCNNKTIPFFFFLSLIINRLMKEITVSFKLNDDDLKCVICYEIVSTP